MQKPFIAVVALLSLLILAAACSRGNDGSETELSGSAPANFGAESSGEEGKLAAPDDSGADSGSARSGSGDGIGTAGGAAGGSDEFAGATTGGSDRAQVSGIPAVPLDGSGRVIKNISLEIRIKEDQFQRQFSRAGSLAEQFGGFVTSSQVSETDGKLASGALTIRVPSDRFEEAVGRLKGLGKVTAEDRSGQDVSKQFVDLEARLKQAKAEEAFFLRLMDEARGISDMIQVQSQLSGVQLRIEEIQGQLNYLRDQTALSTISVRVYEPGAPVSGNPQPLANAWDSAIDGFQSVIGGLVVALGWLAPFGLIALAGLFVLKLRNRPKVAPAAEPPVA
ncbi:hypothetical protein BH23ACT12_BH23ACT12_15020 [soil metagenome]